MIVDNFDQMLEQSHAQPLVMGIALHPYIVGWPHRCKHLSDALRQIRKRADEHVWFTTAGAIAAHAENLPEGVVP